MKEKMRKNLHNRTDPIVQTLSLSLSASSPSSPLSPVSSLKALASFADLAPGRRRVRAISQGTVGGVGEGMREDAVIMRVRRGGGGGEVEEVREWRRWRSGELGIVEEAEWTVGKVEGGREWRRWRELERAEVTAEGVMVREEEEEEEEVGRGMTGYMVVGVGGGMGVGVGGKEVLDSLLKNGKNGKNVGDLGVPKTWKKSGGALFYVSVTKGQQNRRPEETRATVLACLLIQTQPDSTGRDQQRGRVQEVQPAPHSLQKTSEDESTSCVGGCWGWGRGREVRDRVA